MSDASHAPQVGDPAPDFELPSTRGDVRLSSYLAQGAVLLVFYPGDETPVCTKQLCDYRDHLSEFAELGVQVLAINPQGLDSHRRFAERHQLPFPLCADSNKRVCRSYGALGWLGQAQRALVLVGRDGRVVWRHVDWPVFRRSADELRDVIRSLGPALERSAPAAAVT